MMFFQNEKKAGFPPICTNFCFGSTLGSTRFTTIKWHAQECRMPRNRPVGENNGRTGLDSQLSLVNNMVVYTFAKSGIPEKDIYRDLVSPVLNVPLSIRTYPHRGRNNKLEHKCDRVNRIVNVDNITYTFPADRTVTGEEKSAVVRATSDHTKEAISKDPAQPYICFGDTNYQLTQLPRGGGAFCFEESNFALVVLSLG
uniref:Endo/exonuclease/phosphatase domain-containing protein n=1 Tax=Steinernema glaseri TaxID=37863 RepID=A0A1I7ZX23_9BILA